MMHFENDMQTRETPWRAAAALSLATGLLLSGCAADNEPGSDPHATSASEETKAPMPNERVERAGEMEPEALWDKIGEILEDPSTPQPAGGTYADFMNSLNAEPDNNAVVTIGGEQLTCADVTERSNPDQTCHIGSIRQQIFSEYASGLEKWLKSSTYIPEHVPKHVAVNLALNIAENGLASSGGDMRIPHEALIGIEAIRLENAAVYGTTMTLEQYTRFYADVRYNALKVSEQPATMDEWQNGGVGTAAEPASSEVEPGTAQNEESALADDMLAQAEKATGDRAADIPVFDGADRFTCDDLLGNRMEPGPWCNDTDLAIFTVVEDHYEEIAVESGVDETAAAIVSFYALRHIEYETIDHVDGPEQIYNEIISATGTDVGAGSVTAVGDALDVSERYPKVFAQE